MINNLAGLLRKSAVPLLALGVAAGAALIVISKGYTPGLGDLMNTSMQVQHLKLWYAGHADNWPLAAYELKKIKETVEYAQSFSPEWQGVAVGQMVKSLEPELDDLDKAIQAKDPAKFDAAFHSLTEACTACHGAAGRPEIKIVDPAPQGGGPFRDQNFTGGDGPQ
jgi:hypothetical protein